MNSSRRHAGTGTPHAGPRQHHAPHSSDPTRAYRCEGLVIAVDRAARTITVLVRQAHGRARCWLDRPVRFALQAAEIFDLSGRGLQQLQTGDLVQVRTRVSRRRALTGEQPLPAHRVQLLESATEPSRERRSELLSRVR